ncbi:hypothetical protein ACFQX7_02710 [Luedemannella flava]
MPGYPPAPPRNQTRWGLIIGIIAVVLVIFCGLGVAGVAYFVSTERSTSTGGTSPERQDITILACTLLNGQATPTVTVSWEVVNSAATPRDYKPTFVVESADGKQLGSGGDAKTGIRAGQRVVYMTSVKLDTPHGGAVNCKLKD